MSPFARAVIACLLVLPVLQHALQAELKFTLHTDLNRVEGVATNEWSAFLIQIAKQVMPPGGVDHVVIVGDKAMMLEQKQPFGGMAAGVQTLFRDNQQYGIDPVTRTFWKERQTSEAELREWGASQPEVKVDRTGESRTIDGMRAERVTTTVTLKSQVLERSFPGLAEPPSITIDVWVTDAVKLPGGWMPLIDRKLLAELGLAQLRDFTVGKFMLRGVIKSNVLSGLELAMMATNVTTEDVADSVFEIPAGYKEVPAPSSRGGY
jgi:hypothetical protein